MSSCLKEPIYRVSVHVVEGLWEDLDIVSSFIEQRKVHTQYVSPKKIHRVRDALYLFFKTKMAN